MDLSWLQLSPLQLHWVHEISQSALAASVAVLGVVILMELASISRLRRAMDSHLQRVLEQLELLRGETQRLMEAQQRASRGDTPDGPASEQTAPAQTAVMAAAPTLAVNAYVPPALGSSEARLLAALTAARARLSRTDEAAA
jgi:hypothetical protein